MLAKQVRYERRGSVLVLVIGVLAMLFVMGTTQLMVARFEKQNAEKQVAGRDLRGVAAMLYLPIAEMFASDAMAAVSSDLELYQRDYADFTGSADEGFINWYVDPPGPPLYGSGYVDTSGWTAEQINLYKARLRLHRSGDGLVSSLEPYRNPFTEEWRYFSISEGLDAFSDVAQLRANSAIQPQITNGSPTLPGGANQHLYGDADSDGVSDSVKLDTALASMFGGKYRMYQRAISHGGMVMLDRMTHPALLAQVIHPRDSFQVPGYNLPMSIFHNNWTSNSTDESRLRRRYMLPESTDPTNDNVWSSLPTNDLRKMIPFTLGYRTPGGKFGNMTPHWWPVASDATGNGGEADWWTSHMRPLDGLTETNYSATNDYYDRRHLMTLYSYDDLLRPQRNEGRLLRHPNPDDPSTYVGNEVMGRYFYAINPETSSRIDSYSAGALQFETQGRFPADDGTYNPATNPLAYGMVFRPDTTWEFTFNRPGLRTPFSLRDTLVYPNPANYPTVIIDPVTKTPVAQTWTYQASFRRFVQLTGYYLAMIQHTTVPGSARDVLTGPSNPTMAEKLEQFKTAVQLAVNTIDFADNADVNADGFVVRDVAANGGDILFDTNFDNNTDASDVPIDPLTAFTYYDAVDDKMVTVHGFEKQPFITEVYVNNIHKPRQVGPGAFEWFPEPSNESIYAVELYNPYTTVMFLDDFALEVTPNVYADLKGIAIPPRSYIVVANTAYDLARDPGKTAPFVGTLGTNLFTADDGDVTMLTYTPGTPGDEETPGTDPSTAEGGIFKFIISEAKDPNTPGSEDVISTLSLVRKSVLHLEISPSTGMPVARLETATAANRLGARAVVDLMTPTITGTTAQSLASDNLATALRFAAKADIATARAVTADGLDDRLVIESSLQRRKEWTLDTTNNNYPPIHWQFTIGKQMVFPLPWEEHAENPNRGGVAQALTYPATSPQHNLLGTQAFTTSAGISNQAVMARFMDGVQLDVTVPSTSLAYEDGRWPYVDGTVLPIVTYTELPVAPVQLVTSDMGLDAEGRCRAFPTTGTLLLLSRYAHVQDDAVSLPVTVQATRVPQFTNQRALTYDTLADANIRTETGQLRQVDNGHLPIFDSEQVVLGEPRRLQMPWGQLVYEYFTALPIEELFTYRNLSTYVAGWTNARIVDLSENYPEHFENAYKYIVNGLVFDAYGSAPLQEVVSADGVRTIGPRVRGRININMAPWWVLDGLPVLQDQYLDPGHVNYNLFYSLPVPELESGWLDPFNYTAANNTSRPGQNLLVNWTMDDATVPGLAKTAGFQTLRPGFARHLVSYREKRDVEGQDATLFYHSTGESIYPMNPGFMSVGAMCDVPHRIQMSNLTYGGQPTQYNTLSTIRRQLDPLTSEKPFAYVGYLQMVAPMVRMQDWATVKSHVYTIYNLVGDTEEPAVWLRSQHTIDRTRCLYTNDLPDRIVQTEPISYFNAVSDQK